MSETLGWHSLGSEFECDCGETHRLPIECCHIGADAAERLAAFAKVRAGFHGLLVADENTFAVGGEQVVKALRDAGKRVEIRCYGAEPLEASEALADDVAQRGADADFFVAVGSGTMCDLAKSAGDRLERPVFLYPTAASMNGYTSAIVALNVRGLKRTLPCCPATGVFADPEVVATAPQRMAAAGVGDFLSKCASSSDWRAAHMLRGGYYCARPREFFEGVQDRLLNAAEGIGHAEPQAIAVLLDALLLSGLSMVVAGSSAPASGGEHLISHYLDMKHALYGTPHDLHGAQVGVATIHCLQLWEKILAINPNDLPPFVQPTAEDVRQWLDDDWGPVADETWQQWNEKALSPEQLEHERRMFQSKYAALCKAVREDLLPSDTVRQAIKLAGGPTTPEDLEAPTEEYTNALTRARFLRNRFTVLDLAAELGM